MAKKFISKDFRDVGTVYAVYLNNFVVFHSLYRGTCYNFVHNHFVVSTNKVMKSYSQVARDLHKKHEHEITDAIGTIYKIVSKTLFK